MPRNYTIVSNRPLSSTQVEDLRVQVGWDRMEGYYEHILERSYCYYSIHDKEQLIAFVNVISDGIADAFLVDLMVHPDHQRQGAGTALVKHAIADLRSRGVRSIQVVFARHLEPFYRQCGFDIHLSGIIDNWNNP